MALVDSVTPQRSSQDICRDHGIMNRIVNTHTTDWRHDVGSVAYQQQAGLIPLREPVGTNGQDGNIPPVRELVHAVVSPGDEFSDGPLQGFQTSRPDVAIAVFEDGIAELPIGIPILKDEQVSLPNAERRAGINWVVRSSWQPEPQHIHRWLGYLRFQLGEAAQPRETAVCPNREVGVYLVPVPIRGSIANAPDATVLFDQLLNVGSHPELKVGIVFCFGGDEVQEIDLWNQRDIWVRCFEAAQVNQQERFFRRLDAEAVDFRMAQTQQTVGQANRIQYLHDRRMEGIAAKITIKIEVAFKQRDRHVLTCQQEGEHGSGRTTPNDTAPGFVRAVDVMCLDGHHMTSSLAEREAAL